MPILDLTHTISPDTPVYPGDPKVQIEPVGMIAKDGFCDHSVTFGTHTGTHIDAPAHMIDGGKQLKDYDIERFVRRAVCVDVTDGFSTDKIAAADIQPGDAVLFYTGASEYFNEEKYWHEFYVLDDACCQLLIAKHVSIIGLDTGSADKEADFPVHKQLLGADILIIENLTNLKDLVGKSCELSALPLKLEKDGAPVRVVARIDE